MSEIEFKTFSGNMIDIWVPNCASEGSHGSSTKLEQRMVFFSSVWFSQLQFFFRGGQLAAAFSIVSFHEKKEHILVGGVKTLR